MKEITLAPYAHMQIDACAFKHQTLTFLYDYWNTKRGSRKMPARQDITPSDLRHHLSWIFLAEALPGADDFRYRLVGNLIEGYFRMSGTNQTLRGVFTRFGRETLDGTLFIYRKVISEQVPIRVIGRVIGDANNREPYETVYLPLSDDGTTVNIILSAFMFDKDTVLMNRAVAAENDGAVVF